jgi:hypothetical protein
MHNMSTVNKVIEHLTKGQALICLLNAQNHLIRTHSVRDAEFKPAVIDAIKTIQLVMTMVAANYQSH